MRAAHRKHLTRVPVIYHYSCDLADGVTLDKVIKVEDGSDVSGVLNEGDLELKCAQDDDKFCADVNAEAIISAWESQKAMVAT